METFWLPAVLALAGAQLPAPLIPVADSPNNACAPSGCAYDEWRIAAAPDLRLVRSGYEDGATTTLYRRGADGGYLPLLDILPITRDPGGRDWWGYPGTLRGLPLRLRGDDIHLRATFDHDQIDDGNACHPAWQQRLPVVLFTGSRRGWNSPQPAYPYRWMSLKELVALAGQRKAGQAGPELFHCP